LHHDLDATVEEHQRVVTDIVHGRRIGFLDLLRQNRAWIRRIAEGARAHEHVGKSIARGLDFEALPLARGNRDIEVIRIGCRAFHRSSLPPELAADDAHAGAARLSIRLSCCTETRPGSARRAEIIYRNVRDGRIISATTALLATARPAQTIIITRNPNPKDLAIAARIAAEVVASTVVGSSRPASFIVFD